MLLMATLYKIKMSQADEKERDKTTFCLQTIETNIKAIYSDKLLNFGGHPYGTTLQIKNSKHGEKLQLWKTPKGTHYLQVLT